VKSARPQDRGAIGTRNLDEGPGHR